MLQHGIVNGNNNNIVFDESFLNSIKILHDLKTVKLLHILKIQKLSKKSEKVLNNLKIHCLKIENSLNPKLLNEYFPN